VDSLIEKEKFESPIIAVNPSEENYTSRSSDIVLAKDQLFHPILNLSNLRDITVQAGEPLNANGSIMSKSPVKPPGTPGHPEPIHTSDNSITLQWVRPLDNGGAPILGYVLMKRETSTKQDQWEKTFGNITDTKYSIANLVPRQTYEFKVAAVNKAGQGNYR